MLLPIVVVLGVFSRLQIAVAEAYCDPPNNPKNGKVTYTSLQSGSELTLECNDGYYLQDTEPVYCKLDGQWSKTNVECFAKTCNHPDHPEHGQVTFTSLTFGSQLKFKCDAGYLLEPEESVYCTSDGTWSRTDVRCVAKTCGLPEHPENGQVIFTSLNFGSQLKFKCDEGYRLQAEGPVYCTSDGTWNSTDVQCIDALNVDRKGSDEAQFEEKDRAPTAEQLFEDVTDGFMEWNQTDANIDDDSASSKYPDNDTMHKKPTENIMKEEENEDDIACEPPPKIEGTLPVELNDPRPAVGTVVVYRCNFGYVNQDSRGFRSVCKLNEHSGRANWTNPNVACIPRSCGDPGFVLNAQRIGNLFTFPNKVEFQCEEGFKLKGSPIRYCQASGTWSGRLPTCEQIKCARPANPDHGRVRYTSLDYGTELRYECDKGYVLGQHKQRTCTEDGTWSNNDPVCIEGACEMPMSPEHGTVQLVGEPKVGSIAMYSCDEGRVLIGVVASKCLITGQWTFPPPKCLGSCVLSAISNGSLGHKETRRINRYRTEEKFVEFKVGTIIKHGETAIFRCKDGFAPAESLQSNVGSKLREEVVTCEDGQWSQPLECKAELCLGDPLHMDNGYPVVNNRSHGYIIYYRCNKYYVKTAPGEVKCMYGKWNGYTPICTDGRCYTNQLHIQGIEISNVQFIEHRKSISVSCKEGFRPLNNWKKISCDTGKWNVSNNACVIEKCSTEPPEIHYGRYHYTSVNHNSEVKYECDPGYEMKDYSSVKCLHGQWSGQPPDCVKVVENSAFNSVTSASPNTDEKLLEQSENCFCLYKPGNTFLVSKVNGKALKYGEPIRKGDTALLSCSDTTRHLLWRNEMRNYFVNMTCDECQVWTTGDLPSCETTFAGDSFIALDETLTVQPGGDVECQRDKRLRIACFSFNIHYPEWRALNTQKEFAVTYYHTTYYDQTTRFISFLDLPQFRRKDEGIYECSTKDNYNRRYRSTKLKLTLTANSVESVSVGQKVVDVDLSNNPTPKPTASKDLSSSEDDQCSCIYNNPDRLLKAVTNGERLRHGDKVKKGDFTKLSCLDQEMPLILPNGTKSTSLTVILTCNVCDTWEVSQLPTCEYVHHPGLTCPRIVITEGITVEYTNERRVGSTATFSCSVPFVLVGHSTLQCLQSGKWSKPQPGCQIPQKRTSVDSLSNITPSSLTPKEPESEGESCFCTYKGNWQLTVRVNGKQIWYAEQIKKGENAEISCTEGKMQLVLPNGTASISETFILTCHTCRTWNAGNLPSCRAVESSAITCPQLLVTEGMNVQYTKGKRVGSMATFSCTYPLLLLGQSTLHCLQGGQWSHLEPTCERQEVFCPQIPETDIFAVHFDNGRKVNSNAIFSCKHPNFKIAGSVNTRTCLQTGEWSGANPECIAFGCLIGDFTGPENVLPNVESVTEELQPIGSELPMMCEEGLVLIGDKKAKCGTLGKWNYGKPKCVLGCHLNIKDVNPQLIVRPVEEYYRFGAFVTLSCAAENLELTSDVERVMCMNDGWSHPIPDCQEKKTEE